MVYKDNKNKIQIISAVNTGILSGGVGGVTVTHVRNGRNDHSSNSAYVLICANTLEKDMNPYPPLQ